MNMLKNAIAGIVAGLAMLPSSALAWDTEYIVSGEFDAIFDAILSVSHIFASDGFQGLISAVAVLGIVGAGLGALIGVLTNPAVQVMSLKWAGSAMIGIILFLALFMPTGSLMLYDSVSNRQSPVGPIELPLGVVLVAGVTNKIERGLVDLIETAVAPGGTELRRYSANAGGKSYAVLRSMMHLDFEHSGFVPSIRRYMSDCLSFEQARPGTDLDLWDTYRDPRGSQNLQYHLAKAANPAIYTVFYDGAGSGRGETMTCQEAWGEIEIMLAEVDFAGQVDDLCAAGGFAGAAGVQQCRNLIAETLTETHGINHSPDKYLEQYQLAVLLGDFYFHGDPGVTAHQRANQQIATAGVMSGSVFAEWLPHMRGVMIAIIFGLTPVLIILIPSPLWRAGLSALAGFFILLAMWSIADATIHNATINHAVATAQGEGLLDRAGVRQLLAVPDAATKTQAAFGTVRASALTISVMLTMMIVRFGGYALAQMAGSMSAAVGQGAAAGREMLTPQGAQRAADDAAQSAGRTATWGEVGRAEGGGKPPGAVIAEAAAIRGQRDVAGQHHFGKEAAAEQQAGNLPGGMSPAMAGGAGEAAARTSMRFNDGRISQSGQFNAAGQIAGAQRFAQGGTDQGGTIESHRTADGGGGMRITTASGQGKLSYRVSEDGRPELMSAQHSDLAHMWSETQTARHIDSAARELGTSISRSLTDQELRQQGLTTQDQESWEQNHSKNLSHEWGRQIEGGSGFRQHVNSETADALQAMAKAGGGLNLGFVRAGAEGQYMLRATTGRGETRDFNVSQKEMEAIKSTESSVEAAALRSSLNTDEGMRYASGHARVTGNTDAAKHLEQAQTIREEGEQASMNRLTDLVRTNAGGSPEQQEIYLNNLESKVASGDNRALSREFDRYRFQSATPGATHDHVLNRQQAVGEQVAAGQQINQQVDAGAGRAHAAAGNINEQQLRGKPIVPAGSGLTPGDTAGLEKEQQRIVLEANEREGRHSAGAGTPSTAFGQAAKSSSAALQRAAQRFSRGGNDNRRNQDNEDTTDGPRPRLGGL